MQFVGSSICQLRFGGCKELLQKLEDIESRLHEQLNTPPRTQVSQPPSPMQSQSQQVNSLTPKSNGRLTIKTIGNFSNETKNESNDEKVPENSKKSQKKVPNLSLKSLIPEIFPYSGNSLSARTNPRLSTESKKAHGDNEETRGYK